MFETEPDRADQRALFSRRAAIFGFSQIAVFGTLGARLYQLQVTDGSRNALLAEENRISVEVLAPMRGRILDRNGDVLASNAEGYRAVIVPSFVRNLRDVLARLGRIVPMSADDIERVAARARRQSPNIAVVVVPELSWEQLAEINLQAPFLPGVRTEPAGRRVYRADTSLGPVVGYVGAVERRAMNDSPVLRLPGMRVGRAGIERGFEDILRGRSGSVTSEVDSRGRVVRVIDQVEPASGRDVTLALDARLQSQVSEKLAAHRCASAVAIGIETGEVAALASNPGFDANAVASAGDPADWARLQASADHPLTNRAIRGLYPPGSTFKLVTALAGLEGGVVGLKERLPCDGHYEYFGQTYRCWRRSGHEACDLHRALRESCDCYFYEVARRAGIERIAAMARKLGLGRVHDTGLVEAKAGLIPDHDWKRGRFGRGWLGGETILAGIGQGYVLATPLQLAVMTARIASGLDVAPTLVRRAAGQPGAPPLAIDASALQAVRRAMAAVVNEDGGTGSHAQGEDGSYLLAGKTGTAQVSKASRDAVQTGLPWHMRDHALFVCFAPVSAPRYAVATVVEHGGGGGAVAAPLARAVMDMVMDRNPLQRGDAPVADGAAGHDRVLSVQRRDG